MMTLSPTPPKGAGKRTGITKTDRLLAHIEGLGLDKATFIPIGIRTAALAAATGVPANSISVLLAPHIKSGRIAMCKISTPPSAAAERIQEGRRRGPA